MKTLCCAILTVFCIMIIGCSGKRAFLKKDIHNMMQTVVTTPELSSAIINGDSVAMTFNDVFYAHMRTQTNDMEDARPRPKHSLAKMLILFDSTICGSCKVSRIGEYQLAVEYAKAMHGGFEPIFIFAPSKANEHDLRLALRSHPFEWPVFIDTEQKFLQANPHIPKNRALHTFLLDKNNRVVLVGNPIGNDKLWGLYMNTIRELIDNGGILLNDQ